MEIFRTLQIIWEISKKKQKVLDTLVSFQAIWIFLTIYFFLQKLNKLSRWSEFFLEISKIFLNFYGLSGKLIDTLKPLKYTADFLAGFNFF